MCVCACVCECVSAVSPNPPPNSVETVNLGKNVMQSNRDFNLKVKKKRLAYFRMELLQMTHPKRNVATKDELTTLLSYFKSQIFLLLFFFFQQRRNKSAETLDLMPKPGRKKGTAHL